MRNHIHELNVLNEKYIKELSTIKYDIDALTAQMVDQYADILKNYNDMSVVIDKTVSQFSDKIRHIEIISLIAIIAIFFLLLLKNFDLLVPLFEILGYPITLVKNLFIKKNTIQ